MGVKTSLETLQCFRHSERIHSDGPNTFQHGHPRQRQSPKQGAAGLMHYTLALSYSSERTHINLCGT